MTEFKHIVRIADTDLDGNRSVMMALTGIKGIGLRMARAVVNALGLDANKKLGELDDETIERLRKLRVINFEMECATLFTISNIFGARSGAVMAVFANRETGEFEKKGEKEAAEVASEAIRILYEWDQERDRKQKNRFWIPGL